VNLMLKLWGLLPYGDCSMRCRLGLVLVALAALTLGAPAVAGAQTNGGGQQQALQNQIAQLDQAGQAALGQLQGVQSEQQALDARAADLTRQLDAAEAHLAPLADAAARLDASVAQLEAIVTATQARLDDARLAFGRSAAQLYRSTRVGAEYESLLAAQPGDLLSESVYLDLVSHQRKDLLDRVMSIRAELERQRRALVAEQAKADAAANAARAVRDQIAALRDQLAPAQAQANAAAAAVEATLAQIRGSLSDDEAELASLQGASDGISRLLSRGHGPFPPCQVRPVPGGVNQPFIPGQHPGIDLYAQYGDPIHACLGGTVVIAGWEGGYGNAVVIDHGNGMGTLYAHQSQMAVSVGQHVNAGDVIGYIGSTGYSTGPHLHFEVRINGVPVDPAPFL
jgi:murein DD-endopeptidase MepM/ murein hydrolase activator NlpD